jgi:hypothetical protein
VQAVSLKWGREFQIAAVQSPLGLILFLFPCPLSFMPGDDV